MTEDFKKKLIEELVENGIAKKWDDVKHEHIEREIEIQESEIGVSSDGIRYLKPELMKFMTEQSYPMSQEYVDLLAKKFEVKEGEKPTRKIERNNTIVTKHHELEEIADEDVEPYLMMKTLEMITEMNRQQILMNTFMNYKVFKVGDTSTGSSDISTLDILLSKYSRLGWRVKSIVTNDIGVNSHVDTSTNTRFNANIGEIVVIMERPAGLTDEIAKKYMEDPFWTKW